MSFNCNRCGACCRAIMCEHLTEDNECAIYDTRPDICRIDKTYEMLEVNMTKEEYYAKAEIACQFLRDREEQNDIQKRSTREGA